MIPQTTLNQVQLAVRSADPFPARGLEVMAQGSSVLLKGTVSSLRDIDAATQAVHSILPLATVLTDQVTVSHQ